MVTHARVPQARDNKCVPITSRGFVHQGEFRSDVAKAKKALDPREVRDVHFRLGVDSGGEPAVFFEIVLTSYGSRESRLAEVTGRVAATLFDEIQPYNRWGLQPYFSFSDQPLQGNAGSI